MKLYVKSSRFRCVANTLDNSPLGRGMILIQIEHWKNKSLEQFIREITFQVVLMSQTLKNGVTNQVDPPFLGVLFVSLGF